MAWFINEYRCEGCGCKWRDEWSATCDDDCPHCGYRHMTPYHSIDLSEIVEECEGKFLVLRSPDTAEESADYEMAAEFSTREEAEEFLKNPEEQPDKEDGPVGFVD